MIKSNYTKSPQKVSTFFPKILKPFRNKLGSKALELRTHWEEIVGKEIAEKCDVSGLKTYNNKKILILVSDENNLVELPNMEIQTHENSLNSNEYLIEEISNKNVYWINVLNDIDLELRIT